MVARIKMIALIVVLLFAGSVTAFDAVGVITRPLISEDVSPLESIAPLARDGHRGDGFLRKPPGAGPFPAVVVIHPGLVTFPTARLKTIALAAQPSRFLAAGYVVAVVTYRSRDVDPQTTVSLADSLAAMDYVRKLSYVDPKSIVIYGCSGGGDRVAPCRLSANVVKRRELCSESVIIEVTPSRLINWWYT